jgi:hypothetical protein
MAVNAVYSTVEIELSQSAYDELERKLLGAGYEHVFVRGPGSAIDMQGFIVTREQENPRRVSSRRKPGVPAHHTGELR